MAGRKLGMRAAKGAAIGGGLGALSQGDFGGMVGGAGMGAMAGIGMPAYAGALGRLGSVGGLAKRGAQGLGDLGGMLAGAGRRSAKLGGGIASNLGVGMFHTGALTQRMGTAASGFIGGYMVSVNKWGGIGLAALGVGSASMIGASALSSNRGY